MLLREPKVNNFYCYVNITAHVVLYCLIFIKKYCTVVLSSQGEKSTKIIER